METTVELKFLPSRTEQHYNDPQWQAARKKAQKLLSKGASVYIQGKEGTGKSTILASLCEPSSTTGESPIRYVGYMGHDRMKKVVSKAIETAGGPENKIFLMDGFYPSGNPEVDQEFCNKVMKIINQGGQVIAAGRTSLEKTFPQLKTYFKKVPLKSQSVLLP